MKRGDIWVAAGGKDYARKPRPFVIVQDQRFEDLDSITVCAFTSDPLDLPIFRPVVEPDQTNGLRAVSRLMVDKITTLPKVKLSKRIGRLNDADTLRLNRAMLVFLGVTG